MKEQLERYVKQVKEWHEECRGNEQATKASLIAPLFVHLGYNMHDPRECKPEYRMDFGKGEKAATPVDWAFLIDGAFAFFVEAKEAGARIANCSEQLGMYFGKQARIQGVKLAILTNGTQWHFFTDLKNDNAMDVEPFFAWDVLRDDPAIALDLLTILQKSKFTPQLIRTFAETKHHKGLLVRVLNRLLEPAPEFVKLAIGTPVNDAGDSLVSGKITEKVIEQWKPILKEVIHEWAKQYNLKMALGRNASSGPELAAPPKPSKRQSGAVTMADLMAAGVLAAPLTLFRKYKGTRVQAALLAGGAVEFQGQRYGTCSAAAEAARMSVTGKRQNTNGWTFWQYQDEGGKRRCLDDARKRLSKTKGGHPDRPERYGRRKRFWEELLNRPKVKATRHADLSPSESNWIAAGTGVRGLPLVYVIGQDECRVELYIDRGDKEANKGLFDRLHSQQKEIANAFGAGLSWQRLDDKRACRIAHTLTDGGWKSEESKWSDIQDAMIDAMLRLEAALAPHLIKLKTELAAEGA
jgi:hypothetical protein